MVQLTRIYTRGGDKGKTSLGNGTRKYKSELVFQAMGDVDETNAAIALAWQHCNADIKNILRHIQNDLFDVGADLCIPSVQEEALRIQPAQTKWIEEKIDIYNAELSPLKSFVLPGGTMASTALHLARCISRRAERSVVALSLSDAINPALTIYLNRLSDLLFVLARYTNHHGENDVLWMPGLNQERIES